MNELVTACLEAGNIEPLVSFPRELMNTFEKEVIAWILNYNRRHGAVPIVARMGAEYPHFIAIRGAGSPLTDVAEQTLKRKRKEFAISRVAEIELKLRDEDDIPTQEMDYMLTVLSQSGAGLDKYSTFDRDRYFRSGDGLRFGLRIVDRSTKGLMKGDYALITGRLAAGKTTLAQWIANNWREQGKRILFISNEMLSDDVFKRIDGMVGRFNPLLLRDPESAKSLGPTLKVVRHVAESSAGEIIIPRQRMLQPSQVSGIAKHLNIDAIVVDGVYLMVPDSAVVAKWERVAAVSNALKQMALELELPLLGVTQLKRVGEKAEYDAEDIAYSDALGQDSDFAFAVKQSKAEKGVLEFQTLKNRYGPCMNTRVRIDFDTMTVIEESVMTGAPEVWA